VTFGCWASRVRAFSGMLAIACSAPSGRRPRGRIKDDLDVSGGKSRRGPQDHQGRSNPSSWSIEMLFVGSVVPGR
jgi:hypothetical protein